MSVSNNNPDDRDREADISVQCPSCGHLSSYRYRCDFGNSHTIVRCEYCNEGMNFHVSTVASEVPE